MVRISIPFFLLLNNIPSYGSATFCSPIHPQMDVGLGCFHLLAAMSNSAMNVHAQVFVGIPAFSRVHIPRVELLGPMVILSLTD